MSRGESWLASAKKRLAGSVGGLILVMLAFVIVNTFLAGSFNLGIKNGGKILTNPATYIKGDNFSNEVNVSQNDSPLDNSTALAQDFDFSDYVGEGIGNEKLALGPVVRVDQFCQDDEPFAFRIQSSPLQRFTKEAFACNNYVSYKWNASGVYSGNNILPNIYIDQTKFQDRYTKYCGPKDTYATGGCGPASLAMVFKHYRLSTNILDVGSKLDNFSALYNGSTWIHATQSGLNQRTPILRPCGEGTAPHAIPIVSNWYGFDAPSLYSDEILTASKLAVPVIVNVSGAPFTSLSGGHFIVIWFSDNNNVVHISDSGPNKITQVRDINTIISRIKTTTVKSSVYQKGTLQAWAIFPSNMSGLNGDQKDFYKKLINRDPNRGLNEARKIQR